MGGGTPCEEEFLGGRNLCVLVGEGVSLRSPVVAGGMSLREQASCRKQAVAVRGGMSLRKGAYLTTSCRVIDHKPFYGEVLSRFYF